MRKRKQMEKARIEVFFGVMILLKALLVPRRRKNTANFLAFPLIHQRTLKPISLNNILAVFISV